jgi:proline-rich protein PRCC
VNQRSRIEEEDDEFLHKKAVPSLAPPKREKVKIMIPRLSDFKEEDDEKIVKIQPANRKTGLLSMLPKPSNSFAPASKPAPAPPSKKPQETVTSAASEQPKKVGLIPYALMSHNPKTENQKAKKKKDQDSDEDDDEPTGSFFSFASQDEDLPKVSEDEVKAMVAKESARMEQRKRLNEGIEEPAVELEDQGSSQQQQFHEGVDEAAMKALLGGNKAKRLRYDNIQIIDLSAKEVLPDREEWMRKSLAGETSYIPTGNIMEKVKFEENRWKLWKFMEVSFQGPNALAKRKHQISYLATRAENNVAELEAMWASNRTNKRETKGKYGF